MASRSESKPNLMDTTPYVGEQKLTVRVKCKLSQNITLRDIPSDQPLEGFLRELSKLTGIKWDNIALLKGFPPKRVEYNLTMTVRSLGISNHDTIIVELDDTRNVSLNDDPPNPEVSFAHMTSRSPTAHSSSVLGVVPRNTQAVPNDGLGELLDAELESAIRESLRSEIPAGSLDNQPSSLYTSGVMMRKVVPSDNSCLFYAVDFCLHERESFDATTSGYYRERIGTKVLSDTRKYNEAFLGRDPRAYVSWIYHLDSWGGAIELSILSLDYEVEICVLDTQNLRINRFGEDMVYAERIFLIYDGIHYDALYFELYEAGQTITRFPMSDNTIFEQVMELGREANVAHQYTDINNFKLYCETCNVRLRGPAEAETHAKQTGHKQFTECK